MNFVLGEMYILVMPKRYVDDNRRIVRLLITNERVALRCLLCYTICLLPAAWSRRVCRNLGCYAREVMEALRAEAWQEAVVILYTRM